MNRVASETPAPAGANASRPWVRECVALGILGAGIGAFFWPVLLRRVIPTPGDAILMAFPHLALLGRALAAGSLPLWNPYEFSGFPWLATGQAGVLYPPNWLAAILPATTAMSVVVLSAYLIAGVGAYRLGRHFGASPPAAIVGGYAYALGGFMLAHLGHTMIINGAAWLPWLFLAADQLRARMRWHWLAAASGIVGLQVVTGHFQVVVYSGLAVAIYSLVAGGEVPGWRARLGGVGRVALAGVAGGLLAAVQLLPAEELAREGFRARIGYDFFSEYHLPPRQLLMLLFPYLFGGAPPPSPFPATYVGQWSLVELSGYPGVIPFVLALSAVTALWREPRVRGCMALGLAALVLALGPATPIPRLLFMLPGYDLFRAPARHLMSFDLAVAILAAVAFGRILDRPGDAWRLSSRCACAVAGLMGLIAAMILVRPAVLGGLLPPSHPEARAQALALGIPLGFGLLAVAVVVLLRRSQGCLVQGLVLVFTLLDLASFGQFEEWRVGPSVDSVSRAHPPIAFLRRAQEVPPRRIFTATGGYGGAYRDSYASVGLPLYVALHDLSSANGYDPLMLARYGRFLGMGPYGNLRNLWRLAHGRQLDLLSVRHVVVPSPLRYATRAGPLVLLGPGEAVEYEVEGGQPVALSVTSGITESEGVLGGTPVGRVVVFPEGAGPVAVSLRASIETGGLWLSPSTGPVPAPLGSSAVRILTASQGGRAVVLHEARIPLGPSGRIVRVRVEHAAVGPPLLLGVGEVRAVGREGQAIALTGPSVRRPIPPRWVRVFSDPAADVYENPDAMPRAWLVPRTVTLKSDASVLLAILTGSLPDGRAFDPRAVALLSAPHSWPGASAGADPKTRVAVRSLSANRLELDVHAPTGGYLVLSEVDYPGWQAILDGIPVQHQRANYLLRGLPIPPGAHRVAFAFRPRSVLFGLLISLATGAALAVLAWRGR